MKSSRFTLNVDVTPSKQYDAKILETKTYLDSSMNEEYLWNKRSVATGDTLYVKVRAKNVGSSTWDQSFTYIGTADPLNKTDSPYFNEEWPSENRATSMQEPLVETGDIATFTFTITAGEGDVRYREKFAIVAESRAWMNDELISLKLDVYNLRTTLGANKRLYPGDSIRNNGYMLTLQSDGNLVLYNYVAGKALWASRTNGKPAHSVVMQGDGNLVLYNTSGKAIWSSATRDRNGPRLSMQGDGNLVLYNAADRPLWVAKK